MSQQSEEEEGHRSTFVESDSNTYSSMSESPAVTNQLPTSLTYEDVIVIISNELEEDIIDS